MRLKFLQNISGILFATKDEIKDVEIGYQRLIDAGIAELDDAKATIAKQQEQIDILKQGTLWQRLVSEGK